MSASDIKEVFSQVMFPVVLGWAALGAGLGWAGGNDGWCMSPPSGAGESIDTEEGGTPDGTVPGPFQETQSPAPSPASQPSPASPAQQRPV